MSENTFESWDQLLEEYGMTDDEVDDMFEQPWPGSRCPTCRGHGIVGMYESGQNCDDCNGTGLVQPLT